MDIYAVGNPSPAEVEAYYKNELHKLDACISKLRMAMARAYSLNQETIRDYERVIAATEPDDYDTRIEFLTKKIGLMEANCNLVTAIREAECDDVLARWVIQDKKL